MSAMAAMPKTGVETPPMPVATFRPFGTRGAVNLAVNLATTYQRQLGGQAQPVVAAWQTPREVAFTAIGLDNKSQTVKSKK
jgi:spore maturation protein SpmB